MEAIFIGIGMIIIPYGLYHFIIAIIKELGKE